MKRKLFNWLFPSVKKAEINAINWCFKYEGEAPKALGIEKEDYDIVKKIINARSEEWLDKDEFRDPIKIGADMEAECLFRGVKMTSGMYVLIGNTMFVVHEQRDKIRAINALKGIITGDE